MCRLCDRIYRVTESLPELDDCIQLDPEGMLMLMLVRYNVMEDNFYHTSFCINFCPRCGKDLNKLLTPSPQSL
ncbi:hypothetical protein NVP1193O_191 [Vibrio phage 1.193.O._10N.286.52.C6]|nr:hypothetical protein NVP1193O_191 [Vibrio phage 1.193.O._10N.286.52.C6]